MTANLNRPLRLVAASDQERSSISALGVRAGDTDVIDIGVRTHRGGSGGCGGKSADTRTAGDKTGHSVLNS